MASKIRLSIVTNPTFFLHFFFCLLLHSCVAGTFYVREADNPERQRYQQWGHHFAIASQGTHTSRIAQEIFQRGGNVVDAAVAASFAISVERPQSTGIGGGGFMLIKLAYQPDVWAFDFRETAPLRATPQMFLDKSSEPIKGASTESILAVGVPGLVAGLWHVHQRFGKMPWSELVLPAADLADRGFSITEHLARAIESQKNVLLKDPSARHIFFDINQKPKKVGDWIVQKDLADTLRLIAKGGADVFYKGEIAQKILAHQRRHGGLLQAADLKNYKVIERIPVRFTYQEKVIYSMPPPSSGGVHIAQILQSLENDNFPIGLVHYPQTMHLMTSAMQRAFADRAYYMGDPDYVQVPQQQLSSKAYALKRRQSFSPYFATPSTHVQHGPQSDLLESSETTHLSLMDIDGNAVSTTQTINGYFGNGMIVDGTGVILNNEMDDFSIKPGVPNMFGAVGGDRNAIRPGKRPLSSMSPTIVTNLRDQAEIVLGTPSGTRILTCVAQTLFNRLTLKLNAWQAVTALRYHHQWQPDELRIDTPGPSARIQKELQERGYKINIKDLGCSIQYVERFNYQLLSVSDPRDSGQASAF